MLISPFSVDLISLVIFHTYLPKIQRSGKKLVLIWTFTFPKIMGNLKWKVLEELGPGLDLNARSKGCKGEPVISMHA